MRVEVDILGVAAHGSDPASEEDGILYAGCFLHALEKYQSQLPVDDLLGQGSLHCGLIRGGEDPSSYPGSALSLSNPAPFQPKCNSPS